MCLVSRAVCGCRSYTPDPSDRRALHKARQVPTIAGFLKKLVLFFWVLVALFATFAAPAST